VQTGMLLALQIFQIWYFTDLNNGTPTIVYMLVFTMPIAVDRAMIGTWDILGEEFPKAVTTGAVPSSNSRRQSGPGILGGW
jgi:hypothetical protein